MSESKKIIETLADEDQELTNEIIKMKKDNKDLLFRTLKEKSFKQKTILSANKDKENLEDTEIPREKEIQNDLGADELNSKKKT